jgi:hypothetical protein
MRQQRCRQSVGPIVRLTSCSTKAMRMPPPGSITSSSPANQAIQVFRIASPLNVDLRCGAGDLAKIVRRQLHVRSTAARMSAIPCCRSVGETIAEAQAHATEADGRDLQVLLPNMRVCILSAPVVESATADKQKLPRTAAARALLKRSRPRLRRHFTQVRVSFG